MGAFIGEAMAVGPHWYYDLDEMRADYGDITDYTDPKPGRYHDNLKAGELSQQGFILKLMIRSILEEGGYRQAHFCKQLDEKLFPLLDGKTHQWSGRLYQSVNKECMEPEGCRE